MPRYRAIALIAVLALAYEGCGGDDKGSKTTQTAPSAASLKVPPLARKEPAAGDLLFTGQKTPTSYGTFRLNGAYNVRFEQIAPEDRTKDFSKETAFTARLRKDGSRSQGAKLFSSAAATGQTEIKRRGSYILDVTFGDYPYAVRFTPLR